MDLQQKNKFLLSRAGFGMSIGDYAVPIPIENRIDQLFPKTPLSKLVVVNSDDWNHFLKRGELEQPARKEMETDFNKRNSDLNILWMKSLITTETPLLEKMTIFWHGHFAVGIGSAYYNQLMLNIIRENCIGDFKILLASISKSAAMMVYLNAQSNKKEHPNENFAREVMELFTLGRGHYTENDIKEAARAFSGWDYDKNGDYLFRGAWHDDDEKIFLGKKGKFTGDDILNIILEQKQTAVFIAQKIYSFFVDDEKINTEHVNELANEFYYSSYDIGAMLKKLFSAEWFYDNENIGKKIKSPIELVVGLLKQVPVDFDNERILFKIQGNLGQRLFSPPNVAGWPGGKNWINTSTLVKRMIFPETLLSAIVPKSQSKTNDNEPKNDQMMMDGSHDYEPKIPSVGKVIVRWEHYIDYWKQQDKENLFPLISAYLLPQNFDCKASEKLISFADHSSIENYIKSLTVLIMKLPEYQLT